ncbi:hypothetical protein D915_007510 [Fasciola hepatica]|uniref:Uncharacterized protein n=1 Tax=Fasciola hepatica TaxID=6192 RepID=A0A4E0RMB6_FASHE|nr:hypothetical protein D915_007510 [Fasciola hepatica]
MTLPLFDSDRRFMELYPSGIPLSEMIPFYEAIARSEPIKLEWVCPGRRNPNETKQKNTVSQEQNAVITTTVTTSKSSDSPATSKLAEFDFDEGSSQPDLSMFANSAGGGLVGMVQGAALPLRRVVCSGRHPRQPRVANMDKILSDLFKNRKESSTMHHSQTELGSVMNAAMHGTSHELSVSKENDQCGMSLEPVAVTSAESQHTLPSNLNFAPTTTTISSETPMKIGDGFVSITFAPTSEAIPNKTEPGKHMVADNIVGCHANSDTQSTTGNVEHVTDPICNADSVQSTAPLTGTVSEPIISGLPEQMARTQLMDQSDLMI